MWLTPYDRERFRWRIEIWPDGRALVWLLSDGGIASAPIRAVRDIGSLGEWLVGRGVDPDDLEPC